MNSDCNNRHVLYSAKTHCNIDCKKRKSSKTKSNIFFPYSFAQDCNFKLSNRLIFKMAETFEDGLGVDCDRLYRSLVDLQAKTGSSCFIGDAAAYPLP